MKNAENIIKLTDEEKEMVIKALDFYGDKLADSQGYSAGEKYWDLIEKFKNCRHSRELF